MKIGIVATGSCVGEYIQEISELEDLVENYKPALSKLNLSDWYRKHYGIQSRTQTKKMPSDLAISACKEAIKNSTIELKQIDFLILNTTSGDFKQPTTATKVQTALGMKKNSFAMEINMPCAGNIYGLAMAEGIIKSGLGSFGLVVGVDKMSTNIDETDFILSGMFGDAAAAAVVGTNPKFEFGAFHLASRDDENHTLAMPSSGSYNPLTRENLDQKKHLLKMKGKATIDFIEEVVEETVHELLAKSDWKIEDINQLILHQASKPTLVRVSEKLGFKRDKLFFTLEKYGNTSSASVLLTFHEYLESKALDSQNILLIGMGSGLNWGGLALKST